MHRRTLRVAPMKIFAAFIALAVTATLTSIAPEAQAVITTPFARVFSANANGSIVLRGNANLTCPPAAAGCTDALGGVASAATESLNNNGYVMQHQDVDADPATFNSSTTGLTLPAGSTVLFAALYWSANVTAGSGAGAAAAPVAGDAGKVKFAVPGTPGYATVTSTETNVSGNAFQGYANVTSRVAGAGNGTYAVADIQAGTGVDRYAGWALVVAYQNAAEEMRNLSIFDGFGVVSSGSTSVVIPIDGFQTPQNGTVTTKIGTVVYEGDLGKTGDTLQLDSHSMTDARNPANNFFNSTVSEGGTLVGSRDPAVPNLLGVDVDQFDASGKLANDATTATLTLTTGGETFYPGVVTFSTDLYAPNLAATMTGTDTDGGDLLPGDEIAYRIDVRNDGTDTSIESVLRDVIPAGTSYVPGSLTVAGAPVTDAAGDDTGDRDPDGAVFRLGTGADATTGGTLIPGATTRVGLRVRVNLDTPGGYVVRNTAAVTYTGQHTGRQIAGTSTAAGVTVQQPRADLATTLSVAPATVQRGGPADPVTYRLVVTNNGADLEPRATGTLTLPSGVTPGTLPGGCTATGQVVTCDLGTLATGTAATRLIDAVADATAASDAVARGAATGTGRDAVAANDTADATLRVNTAPAAVADTAGTTHAAAVDIDVLDNDTDPEDTALTVSVTTGPAHGTAVARADGTVTYTPGPGYAGPDSFTYTVSDGHGGAATATVAVTVANAAPVTANDVAGGPPGAAVTLDVLANDVDPNGDPLTITAVTQTAGGTVTFAGSHVTFTPDPGFTGPAVFSYTVSDGQGGSTTAQVRAVVGNAAPVAANDAVTTPYRTDLVVDVRAGDSDPNGDPLTVTAVGQPSRGSVDLAGGVVTYRAPIGFSGPTTFTYTISDGAGGTATGTVTVTVGNAAPVAANLTPAAPYGGPVTVDVLAQASDPNGDPLRVTAVTDPPHGTVVVAADGTLRFTPDPRWSGTDTFDYTITDDEGGFATGRVTVTIANAVPSAGADAVTAESNVALTVPVLANDTDANEDPLTVAVDAAPAHGTAVARSDGTVVYTPAPGYEGPDTFHYTITDSRGAQSGATVTVTVVNSAPIARNDADVTPTDTPVQIAVLANDTDPSTDPLTVTGFTQGAHGSVAPSGTGRLVYTPQQGFAGTDAFTYAIEDPGHRSATAVVTVTVQNAAPIAVADAFRVRRGVAGTLPVLANDTDPNTGQVLRVRSVTAGARGTVTLRTDGTVTYLAAPNSTGSDTFDYVVADDAGDAATATVVVTLDEAPTATGDSATTPSDTAVNLAVLGNDTDPEGLALTVVSATRPAHGTVRIDAARTIDYTPAAGFTGTDAFRYTVRDPAGNTAEATVTVTVSNAPPAARDDVAAVAAGDRTDVDVLANDTDPNPGQTLVVGSVGTPAHGTAVKLANGRVRYTPAAGYTGADQFTYVVSDGRGGAATGTVRVTVSDGPPVALPDAATTPYRQPVTVAVLDNDLDPDGTTLRVTGAGQPAQGTVTFTAEAVTYRPPADFSGPASFTYTVTDAGGNTAEATVTVTVGTPPVVPDKAATAQPGAPVAIGLPMVDEQNRPVTVVSVGQPAHGTATLGADGRVVYTPEKGFVGTDSFTYTARDADGNLASATVTVTVAGPAVAPAARNDAVTVGAGRSVVIRPLGNDTDSNGDRLTVTKVGRPRHGAAVRNTDDTITYAPAAGYAGGVDSFTYTISDGHGGTDTATVTVTIAEATAGPPAEPPAALPRTGSDLVSVAGGGVLALVLGAALYWFGMRGGSTVPILIGGAATVRGPGRHRPGRHAARR